MTRNVLLKVCLASCPVTCIASFDGCFERGSDVLRPGLEREVVFQPAGSVSVSFRTDQWGIATYSPYVVTSSPSPTSPPKRYDIRTPPGPADEDVA